MIKHTATLLLIMACLSCSSPSKKEASNPKNTLPYYSEASFTPIWLDSDDPAVNQLHRIPEFSFTNQNGDTISEKDMVGKIYIVDFFFTSCPGICPKMTSNMAILQEKFLADPRVYLLSHSVTPEMDSVPVLKEYAERNGILAEKWSLLTGDQQEIYQLGRQSYFVEEDLGLEKSSTEFLHTENFVLIDTERHIRGIYNGLNTASIQQLIADVNTLGQELVEE